jgi:hypothetical protein
VPTADSNAPACFLSLFREEDCLRGIICLVSKAGEVDEAERCDMKSVYQDQQNRDTAPEVDP